MVQQRHARTRKSDVDIGIQKLLKDYKKPLNPRRIFKLDLKTPNACSWRPVADYVAGFVCHWFLYCLTFGVNDLLC
jgi:hypothetical protein